MNVSPDNIIYFEIGWFKLNATIVFTWAVMLILFLISWLATYKISAGPEISRWQNGLESIIEYMRNQIREVTQQEAAQYLPFLGALFLFISMSNFLSFVPGYHPPTSSLSTTSALAVCVFIAVPVYGIAKKGMLGYLKNYARPSIFMLPFHVIGELSRTLALAVRLFGNVMSGALIGAVLISIVPFVFPVIMDAFSLLIGQIQAYIFAVLALVYIASATRISEENQNNDKTKENNHE